MTYHVTIPLWDFAAITVKLIADCLDSSPSLTTKYHIKQARAYLDDFIAECAAAYAEFEVSDAKESMQRAGVLLNELSSLNLSTLARNALQEFIQQTHREWCQHNDHLAEVGQSAQAGEINGCPACQDCYENHLAQLQEDEEFERSYKPSHTLN